MALSIRWFMCNDVATGWSWRFYSDVMTVYFSIFTSFIWVQFGQATKSSQATKKMRRSRRIEENQNVQLRNANNDFGCGVCGDGGTLLCCDSCPSTFHPLCLRLNVFEDIGRFIAVRTEIQRGVSWFILHKMSGDVFRVPIYAAVLDIMEDSFLPIFDRWTGTNMIRNVISSSTIHGNLAEMPFIATKQAHRRRGNCHLLFSAIVGVLRSFGVEELVIPSVRHQKKNWKLYYNFQYLTAAMKQKLRSTSILKFQGTVQLVKFLTVPEIGEGSGTANAAGEPVRPIEVVLALEAPNPAQVAEAAVDASGAAVDASREAVYASEAAVVAAEADEAMEAAKAVEVVEAAGAIEAAGAVEAQENNIVSERPFLIPDLNELPSDEEEDESDFTHYVKRCVVLWPTTCNVCD
ncbi:hypothetical protein Sjap_004519 [Stephania japonica]|uniref:Zinc finger PHD-type domain-containing protein n=1 Tax=Stephania japonica TaxID=461633 RepID=A0AAP0K2E1_9MAGN